MHDAKWIKLDDLRQPGMRRILEAMKLIEQEEQNLVGEASLAAAELSSGRGEGGHVPR